MSESATLDHNAIAVFNLIKQSAETRKARLSQFHKALSDPADKHDLLWNSGVYLGNLETYLKNLASKEIKSIMNHCARQTDTDP